MIGFRRCALLASSLLVCASALAQSGSPAVMSPLANPDPRLAAIHAKQLSLRVPGQLALSPDGTTLAWAMRSREGAQLHLINVADPDPAARERTDKLVSVAGTTNCSSGSPVWSPDSQTLAFTSTCTSKEEKPGQEQIFLYSRAEGTTRQLTHLTGLFQQAAFSPDGKTLAFLFVDNATRSAGALAAMKPWSGVVGEDGVEVQRVAGVAVKDGAFTFLTPSSLHVYEFQFNPAQPSQGEIAFIAANPPGENNWWVARLYTRAVAGLLSCFPTYVCSARDVGGDPKVVFDPATTTTALHGLQIAVPRFSPDGKTIAFIGGLMSDQGSTGGDIWTISANASNNAPTDVTPNIDGTPTWFSWIGPDAVGFVQDRRGHDLLTDYSTSTRKQIASTDLGEVSVSGGPIKNAIAASNNGILAMVESGHAQPPEIFVGAPNALHQLTHLNTGVKPAERVESVEWKNEGFNVQGWLTYPTSYDAAKRYPLIVQVHGGPSASAGSPFGVNVWTELGYFVLAPNPRGSFGQGERFTAANIKDFGYGDLRDIEAGMNSIEARLPIDKTREGLMGWSYGGFMTMFGVTQTTRFRAAVAGAGLSDWLSYYGENSIDQWMVPFFGATVYDDPAVYAKSSAINFIKRVKTPTLVVVGDRDGECPAPQSFEFWHALRAEGVKTQLVIFPNEGHGFRDPAHIRDLEAREVAWFAQNMPAAGTPAVPTPAAQ